MALTTARVTLNASTPTLLVATGSSRTPTTVVIGGASANTIYVGPSNVTSSTGMPFITTTPPLTLTCYGVNGIYAIASAGTPTIQVMTTS